MLSLAGQKRLVKRLLGRVEHPCPGLGQVAREIAQERSLAKSSFVTVKDDACRGGWRRKPVGQGRVILSRIGGPRRDINESRYFRIDADLRHDHARERMSD